MKKGKCIKTSWHVLEEQVACQPQALAIVEGGMSLSYAELATQVRQSASILRAMGLAHGERFAIWAPNCAAWIVIALAGQALGGILVPLNTRFKGAEAAAILRRAGCKFLFTAQNFLGQDYGVFLDSQELPDLLEPVYIYDENNPSLFSDFLTRPQASFNEPAVMQTDISDLIFTSGTTGDAKGVVMTHDQNIKVFEAFTQAIGLQALDRYLIVNPFFHSFGYKAGWLSCLIRGATIYPLAAFDPEVVLQCIAVDKITVMPGAPTIFQSLLNSPALPEHDISSLRLATTGATMIPVDLIRQMHETLGIDDVFSAYGLTEACGVVSLCRKGDDFETIATTCGQPLPGTELKIVDAKGQNVAPGEGGEIWVRGFHVMQGYWQDRVATRVAISADGWLKTGDLGVQNADNYITITGRKKDLIIVGGFNCYPVEIENRLLEHPDILDVAVVGQADRRLGEVVGAHIVLKAGSDLTLAVLQDWARQHMANYKVPRALHIHAQLPRNAAGKVERFRLES